METQYGEGDAAKSQSIAENYITQGVVGIFGCNEGSQLVPEMPSKQLETLTSSVLVLINLTRF